MIRVGYCNSSSSRYSSMNRQYSRRTRWFSRKIRKTNRMWI